MRRELVSGSGPSSNGEEPQSKFEMLGDALLARSNAALTAASLLREIDAFGFPIKMCMRCSRDNLSTLGTESLLGVTNPIGGCCRVGSRATSERKLKAVIRTSSRLGLRSQHWSFCRKTLVLSGHQLI